MKRCKVAVNAPVQSLAITKDSLGLINGDTMEIRKGQRDILYLDIAPDSPANINKITWQAKGGVTVKNGIIYANRVIKNDSTVTVRCGSAKYTIFIKVTK